MRKRTGSIFKRRGGWWAWVTYTDPITGRRRDLQRRARTRAEACDIRDRLVREIDDTGGRSLTFERATFAQLSDYYACEYLHAPEYVDGGKVAGLRGYKTELGRLAVLRRHSGESKLRAITYGAIREFKVERLRTPTRTGKQRAIASVNRGLELFRHMLKVARREGWILSNPFSAGEALIRTSDERQRERILTRDEEERLVVESCSVALRRRYPTCGQFKWVVMVTRARLMTQY